MDMLPKARLLLILRVFTVLCVPNGVAGKGFFCPICHYKKLKTGKKKPLWGVLGLMNGKTKDNSKEEMEAGLEGTLLITEVQNPRESKLIKNFSGSSPPPQCGFLGEAALPYPGFFVLEWDQPSTEGKQIENAPEMPILIKLPQHAVQHPTGEEPGSFHLQHQSPRL